jgi:hypothetical protein
MKNIKSELDDSLRPEYRRSDFDELVRGKFGVSQVEFAELAALLLSCIGEDEGMKFIHDSIRNRLADHSFGEWTYEIDKANQITLRYWLNAQSNISEELSNPPCVMTPKERAELQDALAKGVTNLKAKASHAHN